MNTINFLFITYIVDIMKKIRIVIFIIIAFVIWILSWIFFYSIKWVKDIKISKQEIFDNDLKCQEYLDKLKSERTSIEEEGYKKFYLSYSIFYSPITNSCLWALEAHEIFNYDDYEYSSEVSNVIVSVFWWESAWFTVRYNKDWSKYCYGTSKFPWADETWYNMFMCNDGKNPELADKAWNEEINRLKWN